MSALKTMLQYGSAAGTANIDSMVVYATNVDVQENGGCCCLWTAPAGVTWVSVECNLDQRKVRNRPRR